MKRPTKTIVMFKEKIEWGEFQAQLVDHTFTCKGAVKFEKQILALLKYIDYLEFKDWNK